MPEATAQEEVNHPFFARVYMRLTSSRRNRGEDEQRERMLAGLKGRVIEVGAGNGLNFRLYPDTVERVLAVEPEPLLREAAEEEATQTAVPIVSSTASPEACPPRRPRRTRPSPRWCCARFRTRSSPWPSCVG